MVWLVLFSFSKLTNVLFLWKFYDVHSCVNVVLRLLSIVNEFAVNKNKRKIFVKTKGGIPIDGGS